MGRMSRLKETNRGSSFARTCQSFVPAHACYMSGTLTGVRGAAGDIGIEITGAATTHFVSIPISVGIWNNGETAITSEGEVARGAVITTIVPIYRLMTAAETSITPTLQTTTFVDNGSIAPANRPITGALGNVAHATNMNADILTVTTPFTLIAGMYASLDIVLVNPGTALFQLHGCYTNYTLLL